MKLKFSQLLIIISVVSCFVIGLYLKTDWPQKIPDLLNDLPKNYLFGMSYFGNANKDTFKWLEKFQLFTKSDFDLWSKYSFAYGYYPDQQIIIIGSQNDNSQLLDYLRKNNWLIKNETNQIIASKQSTPNTTTSNDKYTSISLGQNGLIKINQSFFKSKPTNSDSLSQVYALFEPLHLLETNYTVKVFSSTNKLRLQVTKLLTSPPSLATNSLNDLLGYLPSKTFFSLGTNEPSQLNLERYPILDQWSAQSKIDLKQLSQRLTGPIILSLSQNQWQVTTLKQNQAQLVSIFDLINGPTSTKTITLPDKTKATEVVSQPSNKPQEAKKFGKWQLYQKNNLTLAISDQIIIFGNKISITKPNLPVFIPTDKAQCGLNNWSQFFYWQKASGLFNRVIASQNNDSSSLWLCFD